MGNSMCMSNGKSKEDEKDDSYVVPMSSSSLQNITVEFPKEIEEDLERRKIESFKALAAAGSKKTPTRTTSAPVFSATDPAHDFYEKARGLDVPAVMVPKPWSEVDQILSKLKTSDNKESPSPSPTPKPGAPAKVAEAQPPETIDMSDLMDDLDQADEDEGKANAAKKAEMTKQVVEKTSTEDITPRPIRSLESSLSFSTIHTVKEVEGGNAKPESVTDILKSMSSLDSTRSPARSKSMSGAIGPTTPRKVNVHPRLLARMEAFM